MADGRRRGHLLGLAGVLAAAAALRIYGIGFGLPHTITRPDEDATMAIALSVFSWSLHPHFFDWPTLFMYAVAAAYGVFFLVGRMAGWFASKAAFVDAVSLQPAPLFRIARGLSATAGVLTVATVHAIGVRLFDRTTALIAAFFLACTALHARDSHFGVTDIAATWLVTLAFLYTVKWSSGERRRDAVYAAAWTGLAASTKYNAGLIIVSVALSVVLSRDPKRWRLLIACVGVSAITFVCGTPYALLDWRSFVAALVSISAHLRQGHAAMAGPAWIVHFTSSLRYGMGWPLLTAGLAGLVFYVWQDRRRGILFAAFPVVYYAFIGAGQTAFARYILPVVPFLCLAAAHVVVETARAVAGRLRQTRRAPALAWALSILIAAPSALATIRSDQLLGRRDNRLIAADWIHAEYPNGVTMAQTGTVAGQVQMATADEATAARYRSVDLDRATGAFAMADRHPTRMPQIVVVAECPLPYCSVSDDMRTVLRGEYDLQRAFVVIDTSRKALVYDRDDEFYVPLAGFDAVSRPGPNITIYKRRP